MAVQQVRCNGRSRRVAFTELLAVSIGACPVGFESVLAHPCGTASNKLARAAVFAAVARSVNSTSLRATRLPTSGPRASLTPTSRHRSLSVSLQKMWTTRSRRRRLSCRRQAMRAWGSHARLAKSHRRDIRLVALLSLEHYPKGLPGSFLSRLR